MENGLEECLEDKTEKVGFLEASPGNKSAMRLLSMMSLWMSFFYGLITIFGKAGDTNTGLVLTISFLTGAFAPKAVQSFAENLESLSALKKK